jgi:hypothetical protein
MPSFFTLNVDLDDLTDAMFDFVTDPLPSSCTIARSCTSWEISTTISSTCSSAWCLMARMSVPMSPPSSMRSSARAALDRPRSKPDRSVARGRVVGEVTMLG